MEKLTKEQVIEKLVKCDKDFKGLDLSGLDLSGLDFFNCDLSYSNLKGTRLSYANLYNAKLDEKEKIRKGIILKESMIGYKKCRFGIIVKLVIPKGAIVFSINNFKCRTNRAKVIEISNGENIAYSNYNHSFTYKLRKEIEIEDFDLAYNVECASGIHFFKTREEAENYIT